MQSRLHSTDIKDFAYNVNDDRYRGVHSSILNCIKPMLYDFEPENESELGVKQGELVFVVSEFTEGWVVARRFKYFNNRIDYELERIEGIIPFTYINWEFDI